MSRGGLLQCANNRPNLSQTRCGHGPPTRTRTSGIAQPVVQRSTHRLPCLFDQDGRQRYPSLTCQALLATGCALHAYVLMDNHLHLLVTKPKAGRVAHHMQTLGFNADGGRSYDATTCVRVSVTSGQALPGRHANGRHVLRRGVDDQAQTPVIPAQT
jgi:hypothetical protein